MAARPLRAGAAGEALPPASMLERFRALVDGAPSMMWFGGPDGRCLHVNRAGLDFIGEVAQARAGCACSRRPDSSPSRTASPASSATAWT